jgi:hypothetical protein
MKTGNHIKHILHNARKVTVCLDGWSKKGLTSSFLGISANFFDADADEARHVTLALKQMKHPHTGEMLADVLHTTLTDWGIAADKILMIVSDNGANMVKSIRLLGERYVTDDEEIDTVGASEDSTSELSEGESLSEPDEAECEGERGDDLSCVSEGDADANINTQDSFPVELDLPPHVNYRHMPCMAHTLQLVIKRVLVHYESVISKTRSLVSKIRKSSVAMEMLLAKCNKIVVSDNTTRWNSTYFMVNRLLEIKAPVNEVLSSIMVDSLTVTEWVRLEEMKKLLEPFTVQTNTLQTDSFSLSFVIPAILDLQCHLQQCETPKNLIFAMLSDTNQRFCRILQPFSDLFNPLPAVACLVDPTVVAVLLSPEMKTLMDAAKLYLISQVSIIMSLK